MKLVSGYLAQKIRCRFTRDYLTLKWGDIKSCKITSPKGKLLLKRYFEIETTDSTEKKDIICRLIDIVPGKKIYLDWYNKYVTKEEAKKYILEYGNEQTNS